MKEERTWYQMTAEILKELPVGNFEITINNELEREETSLGLPISGLKFRTKEFKTDKPNPDHAFKVETKHELPFIHFSMVMGKIDNIFENLENNTRFEYVHKIDGSSKNQKLCTAQKVEVFVAGNRCYNAFTIGRDSYPLKRALLLRDNLLVKLIKEGDDK